MAEATFTVKFNEDSLSFTNTTILSEALYTGSSAYVLDITMPDGKKITLSDAKLPITSEYLTTPFSKSTPNEGVELLITDIANFLEDNPTIEVVTLDDLASSLEVSEFPDGEYTITFSFIAGGTTYTGSKYLFNYDGLDRSIREKIDPTAGYYTQYKGSKEEHRAIDELTRILLIREAMFLDYANGDVSEANKKLTIIRRYLQTCPIFKCNCA